MNTGAYTSAGAAGNNQTYDFSTLTSAGTRTWTYIDPAVYPDAGTLFPTANIAMTDGATDTTFFAMSGSALTVVGEDAALLGFGYTAPIAQGPDHIRWPASLGTNWSGPISATFDIDGVGTFTRSGSYTAVVDGAGTLVLPGGTSMEVIRVRFTSNEVNAGTLVTVTRKKEIYSYHTRFKAHPVVRIIADSLSSNIGPSLNTLVTEWLDVTEVGIGEADALNIDLAPNPAKELVVLTTERPVVAVELRDAAGRLVPTSAARIQGTRVELGLAGLRPGFYLVQVTAADGGRATRRLVVE
ncbi:MAG: T9SS type A sorting domain-containing protein [Flavobacteriales bacterium]|nr:T9SS type A sorting domain-containing protein [Flavobacteriales bacterium]